jgi:hypothetical protein
VQCVQVRTYASRRSKSGSDMAQRSYQKGEA